MRTKLVLLLAFLFALVANAETVYFDLAVPYFNANPATNRVVTLQPLSPFPGNFLRYTSSVSGTFYASNLYIGDYAGVVLQKGQAGQIPFQITVVSNGTTVVNAHEITSVLGQQSYPISGKSSWSINASDQRYLRTASVGSTDYVSPGQSTSVRTNGTVFSVDVTGSLTNNAATATFATNAANSTNLFGVAYNSGATNLTSTNTVLKGTTEFRTPDGNDVITADFINDADNHLLSFDFSPGSSVLIGGTGVVAVAHYGAGGALTYTGSGNNGTLATTVDTVQELNDAVDNLVIHGSNNITAGTISSNRLDATAYAAFIGGGSASQTPWTAPINAATFGLTNLGSLVQTSALATIETTLLSQTVKRPANTPSHVYEALNFHYGGTNDLHWAWVLASYTNSLATDGSFDHTMAYGINLPGSRYYNTNEPFMGYGFENDYTTSLGVKQMEHYLVFGAHATNQHQRPWGWSLILNGTNPPTVYHAWNIENFDVNASNNLPALAINHSGADAVKMIFEQKSQLSFSGNEQAGGEFILDGDNSLLAGRYQYGMPSFGASKAAASNAVVFAPRDLTGANSHLLLGKTNAYSGLRWNYLSNRLEHATGAPAALDAMVWRQLNDFSKYQLSYDLGSTVSLGADSGDFTTLGYFTNNTSLGVGLLEVTATTYGANADTVQRWLVPSTYADAQGAATTWYEVLPTIRAGRFTTNHIGVLLDVSGNSSGTALNLRFRRGDTVASVNNIYVTVNFWADGFAATKWVKLTGSTGTGATVAGLYRHIGLTQINGNVGIGTNSPSIPLEIRKDSPAADEKIFRISTSADADRFSVDEDGDVDADGRLLAGAGSAIGHLGRNYWYSHASGSWSIVGSDAVTPSLRNTNGLLYVPGSLVISSNSATNVVILLPGQVRVYSSNGVPFVISCDAAGTLATNPIAGGGSGTPGGSDTHVQFNDGGSFGGDSGFVFNKATDALTVGQKVVVGDGSQATPPVASIAGGYYNRIVGSNDGSFVASGQGNWIDGPTNTGGTFGHNAIITGMSNYIGHFYTNTGIATFNFIGGGLMNRIIGDSSSGGSTTHGIVSGEQNLIQRTGYGFIGGGVRNRIIGSGDGDDAGFSVIGGGGDNLIQPRTGSDAQYSVIPGGIENYVGGGVSFAAGSKAGATNDWVFVWSDGTAFGSTSNKQFLVRSTGGVGINTNNPGTNSLVVLGSSHFASGSLVVSNQGEAQLFVSAAGGIGINTNNPGTNTLLVRGNIRADRIESDNQDTTILIVTNIVSPFGQLLSTGNATNYTIDFNASDKQSITATGNVAFLTINNISNGAMKRFYITNVFKATSNINVLMPTNCLVVTTNSGGPAAIGGGDSTNWVMTITNDAKLSIECHGTTMRTLVWYLRLLQP